MMYTVAITSQGQLSLPVKIRKLLNFDKTHKAHLHVSGDSVILKPVKGVEELFGSVKTKKRIPFKKAREMFEEALARGEA